MDVPAIRKLVHRGEYEQALKALNTILRIRSNCAEAIRLRGKVKMNSRDYLGALEDLNRAHDLEPYDASVLQFRGVAKRKTGDLAGSLEDLNRADKLLPNNAFALRNRGATKRLLGNYKEALEDLDRAHQLEPADAFTLSTRGDVKRQLGDLKGALDDLNLADQLGANDPMTLKYRGMVHYALQNYTEALKDLNKADRLAPHSPFTLRIRGATKRKLGDYKGGLEDLNATDLWEPNDYFTLKNRAIVRYYIVPADYSGALEDITRVLAQYPEDNESVDLKNKIEQKLEASPKSIHNDVIEIPFTDLTVLSPLGVGGYGEVSLVEWRGFKLALKKLKSTITVEDILHEAKTLIRLRSKFIVTLTGVTADPQTSNTLLLMEYMKHGSLDDLLFTHKVALSGVGVIQLALDIAQGLHFLHSQNPKVIHRDLKSANVLLYRDRTRAKIADFGTAKFLLPNAQASTVVGTVGIAAPPEMMAEQEYNEKVDVFSFGVVLYEMLTNKRLPLLDEVHRLKRIDDGVSDAQLKQLVLDCCLTDPIKRPSMYEIIDILRNLKLLHRSNDAMNTS